MVMKFTVFTNYLNIIAPNF